MISSVFKCSNSVSDQSNHNNQYQIRWVKPGEPGDSRSFHIVCRTKRLKNGWKDKKKYFFNEEVIIKPASRSKCFCFSHSFYSKIFHGPLKWKCISLALQERSKVGLKIGLNNNNNNNNKYISLDCNQTSKSFPIRCSSKEVFCKHTVNLQERTHAEV